MAKWHRVFSILVCVLLIAAFVGCASSEKRRSTGETVDDATITTKVKAAIFNEPTLKVLQINVTTYRAEVQLSGFVDTPESARKAGEVARGVAGVKSVKNDLVVKK